MQSLVREANRLCETVGMQFFSCLERGELDDMEWVYQLQVQCFRFIHSLHIAAYFCTDPVMKPIRMIHARAERWHPPQLVEWMSAAGLDPRRRPTPTPETSELLDFIWDIAFKGTPVEQVLILNVVSERLALRTFTALLDHFGTDKLHGPYWMEHKEVDEVHAAMGVNEITQTVVDMYRPMLEALLVRGIRLYDRAINSWAHTRREQLVTTVDLTV